MVERGSYKGKEEGEEESGGGEGEQERTRPIGQRCVLSVLRFDGGSGGGGSGGRSGGGMRISWDDPLLTDSSIFVFIEKA